MPDNRFHTEEMNMRKTRLLTALAVAAALAAVVAIRLQIEPQPDDVLPRVGDDPRHRRPTRQQ